MAETRRITGRIGHRLKPVFYRALGIFVFCLGLALAGIIASWFYLDMQEDDKLRASREMHRWQTKINAAVENTRIIDEFEKNFLHLVEQGVVGDEQRLSWFEHLQQVAEARGIASLKYSISGQKKLDNENLLRAFPGIEVYKSTMTLNMKLAHEGDLFAVFNHLEKADGLYAVDRCDIDRVHFDDTLDDSNLKAYCELGWYTFRRAGEGG